MATTDTVTLTRAENFRVNLRRVFDSWATQSKVAADAGIHAVHINRILQDEPYEPSEFGPPPYHPNHCVMS